MQGGNSSADELSDFVDLAIVGKRVLEIAVGELDAATVAIEMAKPVDVVLESGHVEFVDDFDIGRTPSLVSCKAYCSLFF